MPESSGSLFADLHRTLWEIALRILLLSRHMPAAHILPVDRGGGTDTFVRSIIELSRRFEDLEIDVAAMEPEGEKIVPPARVRTKYFRSAILKRLLWEHREARNPIVSAALLLVTALRIVTTALQYTKRSHYDVIYAVGGPIAGLAGIVLKGLTRVPLVMHFQYTYNFTQSSAAVKMLARAFYGQADALIGNCGMQIRDAINIGISPARCHAIFNWIDEDVFRPLAERSELRGKWNLTPVQTGFFFGGRFDRTKHVDRIVDALHDFAPPDAVFFFAGDGVLRPALDRLAERNPSIRVLGTVERSKLVELHNACDVQFWGSVDVDYPGLVTMEAMFSGLPVVTSNQTMNPLYEGQKVDGGFLGVPRFARLYSPDRAGIRQAITESVSRKAELNSLRDDVANFARSQFGFGNAVRLIEVLADVAKVSAPPLRLHTASAT